MTATHDTESKDSEWEATVTRYIKESDDARKAVNKQKQSIRNLEQSLRDIRYNGYTKGMRKDELETVIRKAEERLVGFRERAEAYSSRLKLADPKGDFTTSMRDKARIYDAMRDSESRYESGEWKRSWQG